MSTETDARELVAPNGVRIAGSLEHLTGTAQLAYLRRPDREVEFDYSGETEVHWNDQEAIKLGGREGEVLFVDEDGDTWRASQLVAAPEEGETLPETDEEPWQGITSPTRLLQIIRQLIDWHERWNARTHGGPAGPDFYAPAWSEARDAVGIKRSHLTPQQQERVAQALVTEYGHLRVTLAGARDCVRRGQWDHHPAAKREG